MDDDAESSEDDFSFLFADSSCQPESQSQLPEEEEDLSFLYDGDHGGSHQEHERIPSQSQCPMPSQSRGRGRGRPRGTTKILRQAMIDIEKAESELEVASSSNQGDTQPERGSIAYARMFRQTSKQLGSVMQSEQDTHKNSVQVDTEDSVGVQVKALQCIVQHIEQQLVDANAPFLQRCLVNAATCGFSLPSMSTAQSFKDSFELKLMEAPVSSNRALANQLNIPEKRFGEQAMISASAIYESSNCLWGSMLLFLGAEFDSGRLQPVMILRRFRYDETPLRNRVKLYDPTIDQLVEDVSDHTKLMQTEFALRVVCYRPSDKSYWIVSGSLPTVLQAVEKTTARCTKACLVNLLEATPGLLSFSHRFPLRIHSSTTDRYSANLLAEKSLWADDRTWCKSNIFCDQHRIAQAHNSAAALVPEDTSGLLSTALAQRDMGALATLRGYLADIIVSKLQVCYDLPPTGRAAAYRQQTFDLLLPLPTDLSRGRKDCKTLVRMKQRYILGQLLNGDLESSSVVHYCVHNCCKSFDHTIQKCKRWLSWAFLPHKMPKYCKSRWTGQEASVTWAALMMAHHNLYEDLLLRFTDVPRNSLITAQISDDGSDDAFFGALEDAVTNIGSSDAHHPLQDVS